MKYYKKEKTEYGNYVDQAGERYAVLWCSAVFSPSKQTPEQLGYELHDNEESALAAWGLTAWVDPEAEQEPCAEVELLGDTEDNG